MRNFSEKTVKTISICFILLFLLMGLNKHYYYFGLMIIPVMIYFSTWKVVLFEDKIGRFASIIIGLLLSAFIFYCQYYLQAGVEPTKNVIVLKLTISLCIGLWLGSFIAKYIYVRIKFFINRIGSKGEQKEYPIIKMVVDQKKYFKKPGSKYYINFYYAFLDVNGEEVKFLVEKEVYDKFLGKRSMNINIKRGSLGVRYGVNLIEG